MPPPSDCPPPPPPHCRQPNTSGMCPPLPPAPSCLDNEVMCPSIQDPMGCMMPPTCMPQLYGTMGAIGTMVHQRPCPIAEMCPSSMCGPGQIRCFREPSLEGCNPIGFCHSAMMGNCPGFCPVHCPIGQFPCAPVAGPDGCMMPPMCATTAAECPGSGP
eukprot:13454.XXX_912661_911736_1 [CDS] Oithona nana genome sequencing.